MPELDVKVRRRYGRTRVYVSTAEPEPRAIGWYDPVTGTHQLDDPALSADFWSAATAESERLRASGKIAKIVPPDVPSPLRRAHPVGTALARLVGVRTDARSYAGGSRGERKVGRALDKYAARDGWHVLHGVQVGDGGTDIDHVVVGPFGVVTVNTKRTSAAVRVGDHAIWVGGHEVPYLVKSRAEARRAYKRLLSAGCDIPVRPALVFVGQQDFQRGRAGHPGDAQTDVAVLPGPGALRDWINRLPIVLDAGDMATVYAVARRGDTWLT
ncbi:MAG TPA: nuclease-related domain-containing protein [Streptosporangiaceae bacterium]